MHQTPALDVNYSLHQLNVNYSPYPLDAKVPKTPALDVNYSPYPLDAKCLRPRPWM